MSSPDPINTVPAAGATFFTDLKNFLEQEDGDRFAEGFTSFVASGGTHSTAGSLTGTPSSLIAYPIGLRITETGSITYSDDLTTQVAAHFDTTTAVSGWSRISGTHYIIKETATLQTAPSGTVLLMTVVTASGSITTVTDLRVTSPIQSDLDSAVLTSGGIANLVSNGQFNYWEDGTTSAPNGWTLAGASGTIAKETSNVDHGSNAAAVTRSGTDVTLTQAALVEAGGASFIQSKTFTLAVGGRSGAASSVRVRIDDGVDTTDSDYHTGGDTFETLTVSHTCNSAATKLDVVLKLESSNHTVEFDSVVLVEGSASHPWLAQVGDSMLDNFDASTDPTITDDDSKGYAIGSRWVHTSDNETFICADATTGAAVWVLMNGAVVNRLINGDFRVAQRGITFTAATVPLNSDDTYLADRWVLLSDGNDIVDVSQETTIKPSNAFASLKLEVETANKKFGIIQIVESRNSHAIIGNTCSLSFQARTTTGAVIENIRAAVIAWDSTQDSVTSDVVSAWNAEGADPTLVANWTYENTPVDIVVTADAFATHKIPNISVDTASTENIAVFIWVDDTDAEVDDVLYVGNVKLEAQAEVSEYQPLLYGEELARCQRYVWVIAASSQPDAISIGSQETTTQAEHFFKFLVEMRAEPSLAVSDVTHFQIQSGSDKVASGMAISEPNLTSCLITCDWSGATGAAEDCTILRAINASAKLTFDSEL